jgi:hypothetical protein
LREGKYDGEEGVRRFFGHKAPLIAPKAAHKVKQGQHERKKPDGRKIKLAVARIGYKGETTQEGNARKQHKTKPGDRRGEGFKRRKLNV